MLIALTIVFSLLQNPGLILVAIPILLLILRFPKILLPFLLVFGAILGQSWYLLILLLFFSYQRYLKKEDLGLPLQFRPFFLILSTWVILEFGYQFNLVEFLHYLQSHNFLKWHNYFSTVFVHWTQTLVVFTNLYLIIISYSYFRKFQLEDLRFGLILAVILGQILTVIQVAFDPMLLGNQNSFWLLQNRFPSIFTDPNAFGISSFLIIGLLISLYSRDSNSKSLLVILLVQIHLTLFSGSRSFFIGIFLLLLGLAFAYRRKIFLALTLSSVIILAFLNLVLFAENQGNLSLNFLPASFLRLIHSLNLEDISNTIFSRQVFNQLNLLIFQDFPAFGIGLNNFVEFVPEYKHFLTQDIGLWTDNNNNFYFGLLSEIGILGFIAFLIGVTSFKFNFQRKLALNLTLIIFLFLLFLGPHFYFTEVSLFFGLLLSQVVQLPSGSVATSQKYLIPFMLFAVVGILSNSRYLSTGLYLVESEKGIAYNWSNQDGSIFVDCRSLEYLEIKEVSSSAKIRLIDVYKFPDWPIFPLIKTEQKTPLGAKWRFDCENSIDRYKIIFSLSGTWIPKDTVKNSIDERQLGVKITRVFKDLN